jgi:asparagine synthase (glutamine-hydrolysing)
MCGLTGFISFNKKEFSDSIILDMANSLQHRGPDDGGSQTFRESDYTIGLGHRRLSVIDLSELGHQPMHSVDEQISLIYNGEIYNYEEIRAELLTHGYTFKSDSDTEVIIAGYQQWGIDCINRFIGMFAIALLDRAKQKFFLIRDRAGVKPLYYFKKNNTIIFASELKALHKHPDFVKEIELNSVATFLKYGYILSPYSIFKDTFKLKAGHYIEINLKNRDFAEKKYWNPSDFFTNDKPFHDEADILPELEKLLKSACEYRMVADVPVGVFLSGGYDSSLITALLQSSRTSKIKTFTIGFDDKKYDESIHARKVASFLGTDHTELTCKVSDALKIIPQIPYFFDEPFGDSSAIPTMLVSKLAREQVTVSLSADAGDEVFGGYSKHLNTLKYHNLFKKIPKIVKKTGYHLLNSVDPYSIPIFKDRNNNPLKYQKVKELLQSDSIVKDLSYSTQVLTDSDIKNILLAQTSPQESNYSVNLDELKNVDDINKILMIDYQTFLPDDILVKVDRATMSASLEGREPLLDHRLFEFMGKVSGDKKIVNGNLKVLLKEITHKYIPKEMMDRPKMGFSIPMFEWIMNDFNKYLDEYLDEEKLKKQGIFDVKKVTYFKKAYRDGHYNNPYILWYLLMFQMWYERWME